MGMTLVRRRVVGFVKASKTKKPHAPLPRRSSSDEMVGEQAKPYARLAASVPRRQSQDRGWTKFLKPTAIFVGVAALGGAVYLIGKLRPPSYDDSAAREVRSMASTPSRATPALPRAARATDYPGARERAEPIVLSQRAAPTDESFLATGYVRRKVSLPHLSGECTVTGGGSRDVAECLRQLTQK